jgi:sugar/nucleoside kinase (ribokinase family)
MDFLAIGDIVVDDFLRLKDARVHCNIKDTECEICMRWGDKIPIESHTLVVAVGNAANAAVCAARLGASSAFRGYVGRDSHGAQCVEVLKKEGIDTEYMVMQEGKKTNYHYVLWYEDQRTILIKHEEFDYRTPSLASEPKWVYLSSLASNSEPYHYALIEWLKKYPSAKLAFQPGSFQIKLGVEKLQDVYKRSDLFFCNKEEAERILGKPAGSEIKELLAGMQALGPKSVLITDDVRGAYALHEAQYYHVPRYPDPRKPFEITGAGDAFASSITVALSLGLPFEEALLWGPVNSSAVIQEIGAQKGLLTREQLEHNLKNPPAPYSLEKI